MRSAQLLLSSAQLSLRTAQVILRSAQLDCFRDANLSQRELPGRPRRFPPRAGQACNIVPKRLARRAPQVAHRAVRRFGPPPPLPPLEAIARPLVTPAVRAPTCPVGVPPAGPPACPSACRRFACPPSELPRLPTQHARCGPSVHAPGWGALLLRGRWPPARGPAVRRPDRQE